VTCWTGKNFSVVLDQEEESNRGTKLTRALKKVDRPIRSVYLGKGETATMSTSGEVGVREQQKGLIQPWPSYKVVLTCALPSGSKKKE